MKAYKSFSQKFHPNSDMEELMNIFVSCYYCSVGFSVLWNSSAPASLTLSGWCMQSRSQVHASASPRRDPVHPNQSIAFSAIFLRPSILCWLSPSIISSTAITNSLVFETRSSESTDTSGL